MVLDCLEARKGCREFAGMASSDLIELRIPYRKTVFCSTQGAADVRGKTEADAVRKPAFK